MSDDLKPTTPHTYPDRRAEFKSHTQLVADYNRLLQALFHIEQTYAGQESALVAAEALNHTNPNGRIQIREHAMQGGELWVVKPGEALGMIALAYGKSSSEDFDVLRNHNRHIFDYAPYKLLVGDRVIIPLDWAKRPTNDVHETIVRGSI